MKDEEFAISRILELEKRSKYSDRVESSYFFSYSELSQVLSKLPKKIREETILFGGQEEAECRCFFFLPEYLDKDSFFEEKVHKDYIGCYLIKAKGEDYASSFSHQAVLGSLMGLGIKRETLGDIYVEGTKAIIFALKTIEKDILGLEKVGREYVEVSLIDYEDSPIKPKYETIRISYESNRLDSIVAESFRLSREEAKRQILSGNVFVTGLVTPHPDSLVLPNVHISMKGKGKVTFIEEQGFSKKGKIVASIKKPL